MHTHLDLGSNSCVVNSQIRKNYRLIRKLLVVFCVGALIIQE